MLSHDACGAEAASSQAQWQPYPSPQQPAARSLHPHTQWPMSSTHGHLPQGRVAPSMPRTHPPHITVDVSALQEPTQHLLPVRPEPVGPDSRPHVGSSVSRPSSPSWQHQHHHDTRWHGLPATVQGGQAQDSATGTQGHALSTTDSRPQVGLAASQPSSPGWQHQHHQNTRWHGLPTVQARQGQDGATGAPEHASSTAAPQHVARPAASTSQPSAATHQEWQPTGRGSYPNSPNSSRPGSAASGWRGTDENALQQRGIRKQWKARPPGSD